MKATIFLDEQIQNHYDKNGQNIAEDRKNKGKLFVKNASDNTTLWAISVDGKHGPDVTGFERKQVAHIQAGKEYTDEYSFDLDSKLILTERIDTHYTEQGTDELDINRNTLIKGIDQKVLYEIQLNNRYNFKLTDINLVKAFPSCTKELEAIPPHQGTHDIDGTTFNWNLQEIGPEEIVTIFVVGTLNPDSSSRVETGGITVTASGTGLFSSLDANIDAECDNVDLSVNVNETPIPGTWNIKVEFTNSSEFSTLLEIVQVGKEGSYFLDDSINQMYSPNPEIPSWTKDHTLDSSDYPQIDKNFKYQVDYEVISRVRVEINKDTNFMNVVEIKSEKIFTPEEVNTYTRTPLQMVITILNVGTADIGRLTLEETVTPFLMVKNVRARGPSEYSVNATIEGQDGLDMDIPANLSSKRKLLIDVPTTDFSPNSSLTITIECVAEKPKPNLDYHSLSIVQAFAKAPTLSHTINSTTSDDLPELIVSYKQRSFKFSANYKAVADNSYEISIPVQNNGEVPLENVYVTQSIAGGKYASHHPLTITAEEKGDKVEFYIKEIAVGSVININLTVETTGPIRQTQPSIRVMD